MVLGEIGALIASSTRDVELIERTLTDGYATALSLEAERWRLQKQLGALAATLERGDLDQKTRELSAIAKRLELQEGVLLRLRELLGKLRREYGEMTEAQQVAAPTRSASHLT